MISLRKSVPPPRPAPAPEADRTASTDRTASLAPPRSSPPALPPRRTGPASISPPPTLTPPPTPRPRLSRLLLVSRRRQRVADAPAVSPPARTCRLSFREVTARPPAPWRLCAPAFREDRREALVPRRRERAAGEAVRAFGARGACRRRLGPPPAKAPAVRVPTVPPAPASSQLAAASPDSALRDRQDTFGVPPAGSQVREGGFRGAARGSVSEAGLRGASRGSVSEAGLRGASRGSVGEATVGGGGFCQVCEGCFGGAARGPVRQVHAFERRAGGEEVYLGGAASRRKPRPSVLRLVAGLFACCAVRPARPVRPRLVGETCAGQPFAVRLRAARFRRRESALRAAGLRRREIRVRAARFRRREIRLRAAGLRRQVRLRAREPRCACGRREAFVRRPRGPQGRRARRRALFRARRPQACLRGSGRAFRLAVEAVGAPPRPATVPPPPQPAQAPARRGRGASSFDPARATLPLMLEIEPRPVDVPSMRATLPMPIEVPRQIEAFFEAQEAAAEPPVELEGVPLAGVDIFEGLPRKVLERLAAGAGVLQLAQDEEVSSFGAALVLSGAAVVCATIVDAAAHWPSPPSSSSRTARSPMASPCASSVRRVAPPSPCGAATSSTSSSRATPPTRTRLARAAITFRPSRAPRWAPSASSKTTIATPSRSSSPSAA
ncbi:MAG: hypothetical protein R3F14_30910 [Polyangiaceae bacterium]